MRAARREGFTLIELMAAVTLFAVLATLIAPRVGSITSRTLRQQAEQIAAQLELARERAVVTGIPHRVFLDLEAGSYRMEWQGSDPAEEEEEELAGPVGLGRLDLSPPDRGDREFRPVPGQFGKTTWLESEISFSGLETAEGWVERESVAIEFQWDGTASTSALYLEDESGHSMALDVLPLADTVKLRDATS